MAFYGPGGEKKQDDCTRLLPLLQSKKVIPGVSCSRKY
jgi:hypothetical protein